MALVEYSDSDLEDTLAPNRYSRLKRKRAVHEDDVGAEDPPPLPPSLRDLYATPVRTGTTDDPAMHAGRRRAMPHVEGNFPSHVYVEWHPDATELESLAAAIDAVNDGIGAQAAKVNSLLRSDLGADLPLHISLSASLNLGTAQREPFARDLEAEIHALELSPFSVAATNLSWASNQAQNRRFLVLELSRPAGDGLNHLLLACNRTAVRYSQPQLYHDEETAASITQPAQVSPAASDRLLPAAGNATEQKPAPVASTAKRGASNKRVDDRTSCFHISVAWSLAIRDCRGAQLVPFVLLSALRKVRVPVSDIKVKIGNVVTSVSLQRNDTSEAGRGWLGVGG